MKGFCFRGLEDGVLVWGFEGEVGVLRGLGGRRKLAELFESSGGFRQKDMEGWWWWWLVEEEKGGGGVGKEKCEVEEKEKASMLSFYGTNGTPQPEALQLLLSSVQYSTVFDPTSG